MLTHCTLIARLPPGCVYYQRQVCNEIWEVGHGEVRRWKGDIQAYKEHLRTTHEALNNRKDLK